MVWNLEAGLWHSGGVVQVPSQLDVSAADLWLAGYCEATAGGKQKVQECGLVLERDNE